MKPYLSTAMATLSLVVAIDAQAVPVNNAFSGQYYIDTALPGTTLAARPELAGTVLADMSQTFAILAAGVSGAVQSTVTRETLSGTLDFLWRIRLDATSTGQIGFLRLDNFGYANITDADWRSDGFGSNGPTAARLFSPLVGPEGGVSFIFGAPLAGGESSFLFFLHTTATDFDTAAEYDLATPGSVEGNGLSSAFSTFAPAAPVPEPETYLMILSGLAVLSDLVRRRSSHARSILAG